MDNDYLKLPRERRRSIAGSNDGYFGGTFGGVLEQQIATSGYDCRRNTNGFFDTEQSYHTNCFAKLPEGEGCSYGDGEQYCDATERYYSLNCPACDIVEVCSTNPGLASGACPNRTLDTYIDYPDTYIDGDTLIEGAVHFGVYITCQIITHTCSALYLTRCCWLSSSI